MGLTWSTIPNICGLPLRVGTLWIAEPFTMYSLLSVWSAAIMIDELPWGMDSLAFLSKVSLAISLLQAICSICLVRGVYKESAPLVYPWVLYNIVLLVVYGFGAAVGITMYLSGFLTDQKELVLTLTLLTLAFFPMHYFITGVYSYYRELKNPNPSTRKVEDRSVSGETPSPTNV